LPSSRQQAGRVRAALAVVNVEETGRKPITPNSKIASIRCIVTIVLTAIWANLKKCNAL
jgi:hypothetical protein